MADLLGMSEGIIDGRIDASEVGPVNRINHQLSEIADGVAMVEAFSHSIVFRTDDGLVAFDTSNHQGGGRVVEAIRGWSRERFNTIVYTHGHIDHVGGSGAFVEDATLSRTPAPIVIGHENVPKRFDRYILTDGYNRIINERQFGQFRRRGYGLDGGGRFLPETAARPVVTYRDALEIAPGGLELSLRHARGETDDHTWTWIPSRRAICAGDFFIWNFPNAGNPQKAQRFPAEWAQAMRDMAAQGAELFLPAHGLPIAGAARIRTVLEDAAGALEALLEGTLRMMNAGARLNDVIHTVKSDPRLLEKPYLRPLYDEPEFVVRNIWRLYGGWWDGDPAQLKPARSSALATEIASLAGGALRLAERALALSDADPRLACHLVELAAEAEPGDRRVHEVRAEVYQARRAKETSLMAKGIFGYAANESRSRLDGEDDPAS